MDTATESAQFISKPLEDPLSYLPCSTIQAFSRKQIIYSQGHPPTSIFLVIAGKVKVSRRTAGGGELLVDIYQGDQFFGESALIGVPHGESAVALEKTEVMNWTISEIERLILDRPKLAIALLQLTVQRCLEFENRIEGFAVDCISRRLARSLIGFSDRFGRVAANGATQMIPFTHELLGQYIGTSREITTHYMLQFKQSGFISYSRRELKVYVEPLKAWLKQESEHATTTAITTRIPMSQGYAGHATA